MEHEFWHDKWNKDELGFHQQDANAMLAAHFQALGLDVNARVFLPLCGKTRDIDWLLSQRYRVVGSELSEIAVKQWFAERDIEPEISAIGDLTCYSADRVDLFAGDFFELSSKLIGTVDAIYDRAALVALPETMRTQYAAHLAEISDQAPQLLISFEYDQTVMKGPPFSIDEQELSRLYSERFDLSVLDDAPVPGGLKGMCPALEIAWMLRAR